MRVLVAPDKFKGSLTARQAGEAMAAGVRSVLPEAEVTVLPIADGGEGTCEVALAAGARPESTVVRGPLDEHVTADWALFDDGRAVLETARASGLALVTPTPETAAAAHCFGSGELVRAALDAGAHEVVVGIGGSAMTDGGSGALRALGARVLDADGRDLPLGGLALRDAAAVDLSGLEPRLAHASISFACDVDSPLTGPHGAAVVFAPQKGADPALVAALDAALRRWAEVLREATGVDVDVPGAGAAGGLPAAFLACAPLLGAPVRLRNGFDLVADLLGLAEAVAGADLVLTGEGSLDAQSLRGKGPIGVADLAAGSGIDVLAVAGVVTADRAALAGHGVVGAAACADLAPDVASAIGEAARWTRLAAERAVADWVAARPALRQR
ncbi:glycerate kinase [Auraticoccus sp. F435]|uniref:Glycerate kinase n=1 Tax=Auraticoccus cholistanensis TaxID=2656650 RepID=A0A6A9V200_9ACTN|nr:glycerate kinase [Auraticoccus cholistanensis]MVA77594.1 glycerate kinase [Auraticoccus cholistanensis]